MLYSLKESIHIESIKDGLALFDTFNGCTHFLAAPTSSAIELLEHEPCSEEALLNEYIQFYRASPKHSLSNDDIESQFQQFVTEMISSGIIIDNASI